MRILYFTGVIVVVDQITKLLVKGFSIPSFGISHHGMYLGESHQMIGDFFRLTFVENPGMAFGIDVGGKLFLTLFSIAASLGILWYLYTMRNESLLARLPLAMILGGAIGNLIDRVFYGVIFGESPLFYGKVVDFFDVDFFNMEIFGYSIHRWPVFNIADACVSTGVVLLLLFHRKLAVSADPEKPLVPAGASLSSGEGMPRVQTDDPRQADSSR